jgi:hypothetical protein
VAMKKFYAIILIVFLLILPSCDAAKPFWPTSQEGTSWVSEDFKMFFLVDKNEKKGMIGLWLINNETIKFSLSLEGDRVFVEKIDKSHLSSHYDFFRGDCKYGNKKFTITVTDPNVENIKIGDKITFNRVDELPDWAAEVLENWENGQLSSTDNTRDDAA